MRAFISIDAKLSLDDYNLLTEDAKDSKIRFEPIEKMHMTLLFFDDIDNDQLKVVEDILNSITLTKFSFSIRGLGLFGNDKPRILYVKVDEGSNYLINLQYKIKTLIADKNIPFDDKRSFVPHITLARVKGKTKIDLNHFIRKYGDRFFGKLELNSIKIKKSEFSNNTTTYTDLYNKKI